MHDGWQSPVIQRRDAFLRATLIGPKAGYGGRLLYGNTAGFVVLGFDGSHHAPELYGETAEINFPEFPIV